jgi:mannose-1-phosphate guanylyltransferase/mannose-1-phosphate guanylyltransferase/mannose-6-phosphate isomerase
MGTISPVILAGGSGTRLWPLSRQSYPKQFSAFGGDRSLFQETALRLSGAGMERPIVLTAEDFRFIVTEQLGEIGILPDQVFIEPEGRDTAAPILLAALALQAAPDRLMLVAPSDHAIRDDAAFRRAVELAVPSAEAGKIVTFGITPDRPETGYGYLELAGPAKDQSATPLLRFVEKPDKPRAEEMLATGRHLWNAGIFLMRVDTAIAAFRRHAADLADPIEQALEGAQQDLGFLRLDPAAWAMARKTSVDYAIMEKSDNLVAVPFRDGWTDLGDWEAVRWTNAGSDGVAASGDVTAIDCADSLLWAEGDGQAMVGLGLRDVIAVSMPDAVLVADRSRSQDVKKVVAELRRKNARQADSFTRDHRPWGWFESLALGPRFQVKRIVVHPGGKLSLQSHVHRAEHWVVVEGSAEVTVGDEVRMVFENQSIYVPQGEVHRLVNPGKLPLTLIEVQTGSYLGEDDIIRHEDVYSRG